MTKIQTQGVHHLTFVGSNRQAIIDFYQGVLGIAATNSGLLITPMMLGLVFSSILTGQLMIRIKKYRYIGTIGVALAALGIYLLSLVTTSTAPTPRDARTASSTWIVPITLVA